MSLLSKHKIHYEFHEDLPEVLKMIRRAKRVRKQRREAQMAKRNKLDVSIREQLLAKGTRGNNRDKSPAKKAKD